MRNQPEHPSFCLLDHAGDPMAMLILAHGAGAPMDSSFMTRMAALLSQRHITVCRFEFGYMAKRRATGRRLPPPKAELLTAELREVMASTDARLPMLIGGKSMGGRVASMLADELYADGRIAGVVCLGYPFHPPTKPESRRTAHLENQKTPTLIVQGERDPFGTRAEITRYSLSKAVELVWLPDGDHDFGPRRGSGTTRSANLGRAADAVAGFAGRLVKADAKRNVTRSGRLPSHRRNRP